MSEFVLIDLLRGRVAHTRHDVRVGIGDDGAVLAIPSGMDLVVSIDTLVSGVHFRENSRPADIGWKALAVNLSDLAAMGAEPAWATLALTLPEADKAWVGHFAEGFALLAREFGVDLVGGDTTQGPLSVTVQMHGLIPPGVALRRNGAKSGDLIMVTGTLGDAAGGLSCLSSPRKKVWQIGSFLHDAASASMHLLKRLHRPQPRVLEGQALRGLASSAIDVSDGLLADLGHICTASRVGATLERVALAGAYSVELATLFTDEECERLALGGGDDYELLFTAPPEKHPEVLKRMEALACPVTVIGRVRATTAIEVVDENGDALPLPKPGFQHFT